MIIGDRFEAGFGGTDAAGIADNDVAVRQMVEQRRQTFLKQRKPVIHAREATAFADRLIERIAGCRRAKGFAIARAEALDRFLVKQRFGGGEQGETFHASDGALVSRVETAHTFDFVAEEIETERMLHARREEIDEAPAHGKITSIGNGFASDIAIRREQRRKRVTVDPFARRQSCGQRPQAKRRQCPLCNGVDGRDEQLGLGRLRLQRRQRCHPLRCDSQARRCPVVGQTIPSRELQHVDFGREPDRGVGNSAHCGIIGGNQHGARVRRPSQVRHQRRQESIGHPRQRQRCRR